MSMFKKRNRKNIRTRKTEEDETEEDNGGQPTISTSSSTPGLPAIPQKTAIKDTPSKLPKAMLSFEDELAESSFKVRKSDMSRRMAKERVKDKMTGKKKHEQYDNEEEDDMVVEHPSVLMDDEVEEEGVASVGHHLQSGMIPDATMIHAIRKKREMVREMGVASVDYIPLDNRKGGGAKVKSFGKAKGKSRLIREDEHDISDEEGEDGGGAGGGGRVVSFGTTNEPGRQMQVLSGLENLASDSEDEETKRWEEEMINKGMKASNQLQDPVIPHGGNGPAHPYLSAIDPTTQSYVYAEYGYPDHAPYVPAPTPGYSNNDVVSQIRQQPVVPEKLVPITMETLKSKLINRLEDFKDTHRRHIQQLEQIEKDVDLANKEITRLEEGFPMMEGRYAFFQQMRSYVRDLLSCLAIKNPVIKALDQKLMTVRQKRAEFLIERRQKDVIDETEECASGGKSISVSPEVEARQRRSVEREARRRRRREKRQKEGTVNHEEGVSTDDELLETNRLKFVGDEELVNEKLNDIFSDVVEDFHRLYVIKTRFEQWKFSYPNAYNQAFVSMCLPKLFVPFVTLQLINWNPLEDSSTELQSMKWFQVLLFYGHEEGEAPIVSDDDNILIPLIIDKAVLPKLTNIVNSIWDPLSTRQTTNLVKIIKELFNEYCVSHTPQQDDLMTAVNIKIQKTINTDVFIPLMSSLQLQNNNTREYLFYQRQFWSTIKLLSNILLWREILPDSTLQKLVLEGLISRYLLLSLQNSPVDKLTVKKTEKLFSLLPRQWLTEYSVSKSRPLQSLKRFLGNLIETLKRDGMGSNEHMKKTNKALEERIKHIEEMFG